MWPKLEVTDAATERRTKETQAKRKGTSSGNKADPGPSIVHREQDSPASKLVTNDDHIRTSPPPSKPTTTPVVGPNAVVTLAPDGGTDSFFFPGIIQFKSAFSDPNTTPLTFRMKAIDLCRIGIRECGHAEELQSCLEDRTEVIWNLAQELSDAGADVEEDDSDDGEVSKEDGMRDAGTEGGSEDETNHNQDEDDEGGEDEEDASGGENEH